MKEEILTTTLRKVGLTESETKVYLAILELGSSSKTDIIRESKIASSKLYEVTDKLIEKGLCSIIIKDGVKYFSAALPSTIKNYLKHKKEELAKEELILDKILPTLEKINNDSKNKVKIETFIGWKGMDTAYNVLLNNAKKGEEVFIIGAGIGENEQKLELFFTKHGRIAFEKDLKIRVIFNENSRNYVDQIENNIKIRYDKKFLFSNTSTEITILDKYTGLLIKRSEPIILLINDIETSKSFKNYFNALWNIAKK